MCRSTGTAIELDRFVLVAVPGHYRLVPPRVLLKRLGLGLGIPRQPGGLGLLEADLFLRQFLAALADATVGAMLVAGLGVGETEDLIRTLANECPEPTLGQLPTGRGDDWAR